jgi:hypothetical protein
MKALLITYKGEKKESIELADIADDHDWSGGPYQDTVPFPVGSNQQVVSLEHELQRMFFEVADRAGNLLLQREEREDCDKPFSRRMNLRWAIAISLCDLLTDGRMLERVLRLAFAANDARLVEWLKKNERWVLILPDSDDTKYENDNCKHDGA